MAASSPSTRRRDRARRKASRPRAMPALKRAVEIREMVARHIGYFELALRADDAARIVAAGKRIVFRASRTPIRSARTSRCSRPSTISACGWSGPVHFTNNDLGEFRDRSEGPGMARTFAAGQGIRRRGEPARHRARCVPCLRRGVRSDAGAFDDADHPVAFGRERRVQPSAQHRRRAHHEARGGGRRHPDQFLQRLS